MCSVRSFGRRMKYRGVTTGTNFLTFRKMCLREFPSTVKPDTFGFEKVLVHEPLFFNFMKIIKFTEKRRVRVLGLGKRLTSRIYF